MTDFINALGRKALKKPGRTFLQLAVVAAGALAFSASLSIAGSLKNLEQATYRYRIAIGNGSTDETGQFNWTRTAGLNRTIIEALPAESALIKRTAAVNSVRWNTVRYEGSRFRIRSVIAAGEDYPDIMGLKLVAGRFFDRSELQEAQRLIVVSETVAREIFGSAQEAIGKNVESEGGVMVRMAGGGFGGGQAFGAAASNATRMNTTLFTIIGVYKDPSPVALAALGLPDALVPFTVEGGAQRGNTPVRTFVAETNGATPAQVAAAVRLALDNLGMTDQPIEGWEGSPFSPNSDAAAEARRMLNALAGALVGLGSLVLLVSVLGVYSWTSMEAADSVKQTAIRRALGESAGGSIQRFVIGVALFGTIAGLVGALLSLPAYQVLAGAAESVLSSSGTAELGLFPALPPPWAPLLAVLATALVCALFALPPAYTASRVPITSGIQEL